MTAGLTPDRHILGIVFIARLVHRENLLLQTILEVDPEHISLFRKANDYHKNKLPALLKLITSHPMQPQIEQDVTTGMVPCSMCDVIFKKEVIEEIRPRFHYPPHPAPDRMLCQECLHALHYVTGIMHCATIVVEGCEPNYAMHQGHAADELAERARNLLTRPFHEIQGSFILDHIFA